MKKNDGGPAFPQPPCPDCGVRHEPAHIHGMSLRDYFAAKAMQGSLANPDVHGDGFDSLAEYSYEYADAMLKARKR